MTDLSAGSPAGDHTTQAFCSACGHQAPTESVFCGRCGQPLAAAGNHTVPGGGPGGPPPAQPPTTASYAAVPPAGGYPPVGYPPTASYVAVPPPGGVPPGGYPPAGYPGVPPPPPPGNTNTGLMVGLIGAGLAVLGVIIAVIIVLAGGSSTPSPTATAAALTSASSTPTVTAVAPDTSQALAASNGSGGRRRSRAKARVTTRTVTAAGASSTPAVTSGPSASIADTNGARQAVMQEWNAISSGNFAAAYNLFVPGSQGTSESSFISGHQQYAPISASVTVGPPTFNSSTDATVPLVSLQTRDSSGCKNWAGSYDVQDISGQWLINRANIQSSPC
jgi:hypothetical protein